ncbi:MAG: RelA/SpoT family protein, partial [Patescibacteria group bacterium]
LIACLLHDVPEDTAFTLEDVEKRFGKKVAFLVQGITKLSKVHYRHNMEERQIESLKKLFIHSAQDPRIILIKLADRLHNMMTIHAIPQLEKRMRIARETLEVYVPIANLLGIWDLKSQLEDFCFKTLNPGEYERVEKLVQEHVERRQEVLKKTIKNIATLLKKNAIGTAVVEGRTKSLYSLYLKMTTENKSFQEIYDLIGLRVVVEDVGQCYQALGILHQKFTPKPGRLKDYIAIPKSNGYQSIHTTVFGLEGTVTEIQIRTREMHLEAEYGVAAHFFYKKGKSRNSVLSTIQSKSQWVQRILDLQRDMDTNKNFLEELKMDIFEDRIFVFTPKGDVVDLPAGSIALDFAYNIHSDIGDRALSVFINGQPANLNSPLKTGDVIYVVTSHEAPKKLEWLDKVQSNMARNRIRDSMKILGETRMIEEAESILERKLSLLGGSEEMLSNEQKKTLSHFFKKKNWEELLLSLASGSQSMGDVLHALTQNKKLFGEAQESENIHVYDPVLRRHPNAFDPSKIYRVPVRIESRNRVGLLHDISKVLTDLEINIVQTNTSHDKKGLTSRLDFILEIRDAGQYEDLLHLLLQIPDVMQVIRLQQDAKAHQSLKRK